MTGDDLREAIRLAAGDMGGVGDDIRKLAREARIQIVSGDERKNFFRHMSQDEFDILHDVAMSLGTNGLVALERLMNEANDTYKEDNA